MKTINRPRLLRASSILALLALGLIVVSLLWPLPILVIGAMSIGQLLGTLSFACFLVVVLFDLRASQPGEPTSGDTGPSPAE